MKSIDNDLFDSAKILYEIEFINKSKYFEMYESLKSLIKNRLSEITLVDSNNINHKTLFLNFYENNDYNNKLINNHISKNEFTFKIFVSILEPDKSDKIKQSFKNFKKENENHLCNLIFIGESQETDIDIIYLPHDNELIIDNLSSIVISQIKVLNDRYDKSQLPFSKFEEQIELLKKNKNIVSLKSIADNCILIGDYKHSYHAYYSLYEVSNKNSDNFNLAKAKEGIGVSLFMIEYSKLNGNIKELLYNAEIENGFENSYIMFRKLKMYEFAIESLFKYVYYLVIFPFKNTEFLNQIKRIYDDLYLLNKSLKLFYLLKISDILKKFGFKRKSTFYLYMV